MTVQQERLMADLSSLGADEFAALVGELWGRCGWETELRPRAGADDAARLLATRRSPVPRTHLLRASEGVGDREVRAFAAADPPADVDARVLVTPDSPTPATRDLAADLGVEIVDGASVADLLVENDAADLLAGSDDDPSALDHRGEELFEPERRSDEFEILEASPFADLEACPFCNTGRNNGAYFYPGTGRRTIDGGRLWSADVFDRTDGTATRNLRCDACAANWVEARGGGRESLWKLTSATRIRTGKREFVEREDFPVASLDEWARVDLDAGVLFPHPFDVPGTEFETPPEPFDGWDACPNCSAAGTVSVASLDGRSGRALKCRRCGRSWTERRRLLRANRWRIDAPDTGGTAGANGAEADAEGAREATLAEWEREAADPATD